MCGKSAIQMKRDNGGYRPVVEGSKCNNCGLCLKICPGHSVDFVKLNDFVFPETQGSKYNPHNNVLLGNFLNCYVGYSTDRDIRWNATSGGLVTALLSFVLEQGEIDGALVIRMSKYNPLEPEPVLARTKEDLITASGSKYCPAPINVAIRKISKEKGKFAIVGLPCHIHGIRNAEMLNKRLKEKIILHLGLFCSHNISFQGTEFFLQQINVRQEDISKLDYRGKGWPGGTSIKLKNGCEKFFPYLVWAFTFPSYFFTPPRCILCCDGTSELADLSFGDPWLPEYKDEEIGQSIVVSRTVKGERLLQDAQTGGTIKISIISPEKVIHSQRFLDFKKRSKKECIGVIKWFNNSLPQYNAKLLRSGILTKSEMVLMFVNTKISSRPLFRKIPLSLLVAYNRLLKAVVKRVLLKPSR